MRKRIWLIDDDKEMLLLLAEIFQNRFEIEVFSRSEDLLQAIQTHRSPHVVISDFKMPGLNGLEVVEKLRDNNHHAPVILISGFVDKDLSLGAIDHHVFQVIEKPFHIPKLRAAVEQALAFSEKLTMFAALKSAAEEFLDVALKINGVYRERAEEAEQVLKELGLLPGMTDQYLWCVVSATDLEARAEALKEVLDSLQPENKPSGNHQKAA